MDDLELKQTLQRLEEQQQKILSELGNSNRPQKRDHWEKIAAISPILSGLFIALSALLCTYQYNQQQIKLQEAQTVERFIPHLMGNDTSKRMAILAMKTLVNTDLAAKYAAMFPSAGTISALKTIAKTGDSQDKKIVQQVLGKTSETLPQDEGKDDDASPLILEGEDQPFTQSAPAAHQQSGTPNATAASSPEATADDTKFDPVTGEKIHKKDHPAAHPANHPAGHPAVHPAPPDEKNAPETQSKQEEFKPVSSDRSKSSTAPTFDL